MCALAEGPGGAPPVESTATNLGCSSFAAAWHWRSSSTSFEGKVWKSTSSDCSVLSAWNSSSEMSSV